MGKGPKHITDGAPAPGGGRRGQGAALDEYSEVAIGLSGEPGRAAPPAAMR